MHKPEARYKLDYDNNIQKTPMYPSYLHSEILCSQIQKHPMLLQTRLTLSYNR